MIDRVSPDPDSDNDWKRSHQNVLSAGNLEPGKRPGQPVGEWGSHGKRPEPFHDFYYTLHPKPFQTHSHGTNALLRRKGSPDSTAQSPVTPFCPPLCRFGSVEEPTLRQSKHSSTWLWAGTSQDFPGEFEFGAGIPEFFGRIVLQTGENFGKMVLVGKAPW